MSKGKRRDQRIELSDGWAQYMGDGYFLVGQISDDAGDNDDGAVPRRRGEQGDVALLKRGERHESVVISLGDMQSMVAALAA